MQLTSISRSDECLEFLPISSQAQDQRLTSHGDNQDSNGDDGGVRIGRSRTMTTTTSDLTGLANLVGPGTRIPIFHWAN